MTWILILWLKTGDIELPAVYRYNFVTRDACDTEGVGQLSKGIPEGVFAYSCQYGRTITVP